MEQDIFRCKSIGHPLDGRVIQGV